MMLWSRNSRMAGPSRCHSPGSRVWRTEHRRSAPTGVSLPVARGSTGRIWMKISAWRVFWLVADLVKRRSLSAGGSSVGNRPANVRRKRLALTEDFRETIREPRNGAAPTRYSQVRGLLKENCVVANLLTGEQTGSAPEVVLRSDPHDCRPYGYGILRGLFHRHDDPRVEGADGIHGAGDHARPRTLYVGLDHVDARQSEFGDQLVHGRNRDIGDDSRTRPMFDEAIARRPVSVGIEHQPLFFIP